MSGLELLAHKQLHEEILSFLLAKDVMNHRLIHSKCEEVVLHHAASQIQDVLGQDYEAAFDGITTVAPRTVRACFVVLAKVRGELDQLLATSASGVRCIDATMIWGESYGKLNRALCVLCDALTQEPGQRNVEPGNPLLGKCFSQLQSLNVAGCIE